MADTKISGLPASTTPLAGTEVLPIVQGTTTKQVAVSDLTAGRAVSALSVTSTNDASISGITVGKGGGAVASNTALGKSALSTASTAVQSVAVGFQALTTSNGNNNVGVGYNAGYLTNSGIMNVFVGSPDGSFNYSSGRSNTTGSYNTAIGNGSLGSNSTSSFNTSVGYQSGLQTTGQYNQLFGYAAGYGLTSGSYNVILGSYTGSAAPISATGSNWIVLSDGQGTVGAYYQTTAAVVGWYQNNNSAAWSITSDARIKKNVASLESGLNVISALRPVEFDYIKDNKHDVGFIAQEYQTVLPAQIEKGEDGMLSLNQNLVPYLVKAIQELTAEIQFLKSQLGV